jgi:hypothetical protein
MQVLPQTNLDAISTVARSWGIEHWDALLVGDGSGSGWLQPMGWCCVLIDRAGRARQRFYGGANLGTSVMAELLPYVQALSWYEERRSRLGITSLCTVHVVTDCKPIEQDGAALHRGAKSLLEVRANKPLWAAMQAFESQGYILHFHYIERATAALNVYCDDVSKQCFHAMKHLPEPHDGKGRVVSIYECNPDEEDMAERPRPRKQRGKAAG